MKKLIIGGLAAFAIMNAVPANAEPGGYSEQDSTFYRLLTQPKNTQRAIVVTNWELLREQGLTTCQHRQSGMNMLDARYQLMAEGPYSFDTANSIASAAEVAYCVDVIGR